MHLASRTTSRNRGAAGHQNLCLTSHTKNSVCRTTAKQPLRGACLICKNKLSWFAEQKLFAATVPLVAWAVSSYDTKIWLVIFVTGGSSRLHLVVVTRSPFCRFLFLTLSVSWSHSSLPLFILGLVALSSSLSFSSSPQTLPTFSSAPHMRHSAAPTFPPPFSPSFAPLPLHYSLHLDPVQLGQTAGGSPHSLLLVQDLSASGTETETTHSQCCGFGRKVFVKLLPVSTLWVLLLK